MNEARHNFFLPNEMTSWDEVIQTRCRLGKWRDLKQKQNAENGTETQPDFPGFYVLHKRCGKACKFLLSSIFLFYCSKLKNLLARDWLEFFFENV